MAQALARNDSLEHIRKGFCGNDELTIRVYIQNITNGATFANKFLHLKKQSHLSVRSCPVRAHSCLRGRYQKELASASSLLRENSFRWQQNTQETPWNMGNQNIKQRTSRCWDSHMAESCACFPWKKIHIFKGKKNSLKENEEISSARIQAPANHNSMEDLCYTVINHSVPRLPAGDFTEGLYENVSPKAVKFLGRMETEYSLLRVTSTPKLIPSTENEYELLGLNRIYSHSLQQRNFL
ncbi:germinal center-associated signaling and motility protein [Sorex fumeus]|uniref:germinal center-associated signaling and motility protein n=1 Tax=Sorex fumeus TaxID=62283 RepID=UPI0024AE167A|nr:germinal center-associated signaling and motility protein [Sorex fumeus]